MKDAWGISIASPAPLPRHKAYSTIMIDPYFTKGTRFFKWGDKSKDAAADSSSGDYTIHLRIDAGGHILYWRKHHYEETDTGYLFIDEIVDIRSGKYARIGLASTAEDFIFTVVTNTDFVHPQFYTFMHKEDEQIAKRWKDFLWKLSQERRKHFHGPIHHMERVLAPVVNVPKNDLIPLKKIVSALAPGPHGSSEKSALHRTILKSSLAHHEEKIPRDSITRDFIFDLYLLTTRRNDLEEIFKQISGGKEIITKKQLQTFIAETQHDCRLNEQLYPAPSELQVSWIITRFCGSKAKGMRYREFARFMLSDEMADLDWERFELNIDNLHESLAQYYISTSHNTYATGSQLNTVKYFISVQHDRNIVEVEVYRQVLLGGCRCIELDCWDGPNDEPIITHGPMEVTKMNSVSFKEVCEAIAESGFKTSELPIILSIENHCNVVQQRKMAQYFREAFGDLLLDEPLPDFPLEEGIPLPSPWQLRRKILIKAKRTTQSRMRSAYQHQKNSVVSQDSVSEYSVDSIDVNNAHERALAHYLQNRKEQRRQSVSGNVDDVMQIDDEAPEEKRISRLLPMRQMSTEALATPTSAGSSTSLDDHNAGGRKLSEVSTTQIKIEPEKKTLKVALEFAALVNYVQSENSALLKVDDPNKPKNYYIMHSLSEEGMSKLVKSESRVCHLVKHNTKQFTRVYPSGIRISSSNYLPMFCWMVGSQMAALNFQTAGLPMQLNQMLFRDNGFSGYVLKPQCLRNTSLHFNPYASDIPATISETLTVTVISGQFLTMLGPAPSTLVTVDLYDLPKDTIRNRYSTKIVHKNGLNPVYEQSEPFVFEKILKPEGAFLVIRVFDTEGSELAHRILPVHKMNRGYRHVILNSSKNGRPIGPAAIFCHFDLNFYVPPVHREIQLALMDPIAAMQRREQMSEQFTDPAAYRMQSPTVSTPSPVETRPRTGSVKEEVKKKLIEFLFGSKM